MKSDLEKAKRRFGLGEGQKLRRSLSKQRNPSTRQAEFQDWDGEGWELIGMHHPWDLAQSRRRMRQKMKHFSPREENAERKGKEPCEADEREGGVNGSNKELKFCSE